MEELVEVDFAKQFKEAIVLSSVLEFQDESLKEIILSTEDEQLLVVTSVIDSSKIVKSVAYYNKEFLLNVL